LKRENVYKLIDGEREYQDRKWGGERAGRPHTDAETPIANWLIYIQKQLAEATDAVYKLDESLALEHIRKIAGLAVACMENNNTKSRGE
jgi:hypothetical protein